MAHRTSGAACGSGRRIELWQRHDGVYVAGAFLLRRTNGRKVKLLAAGGAGLVVTVAYLTAAWDLFPQHWALPGPRQHYSVRENVQGLMALTHLLIPVMSATVMLVAL